MNQRRQHPSGRRSLLAAALIVCVIGTGPAAAIAQEPAEPTSAAESPPVDAAVADEAQVVEEPPVAEPAPEPVTGVSAVVANLGLGPEEAVVVGPAEPVTEEVPAPEAAASEPVAPVTDPAPEVAPESVEAPADVAPAAEPIEAVAEQAIAPAAPAEAVVDEPGAVASEQITGAEVPIAATAIDAAIDAAAAEAAPPVVIPAVGAEPEVPAVAEAVAKPDAPAVIDALQPAAVAKRDALAGRLAAADKPSGAVEPAVTAGPQPAERVEASQTPRAPVVIDAVSASQPADRQEPVAERAQPAEDGGRNRGLVQRVLSAREPVAPIASGVVGVGNGGTGTASADGGIIVTGDIITGYNQGNTISAGGACGGAIGIDGGNVTNTTNLSLSAGGGAAIGDVSGGGGNVGIGGGDGDDSVVTGTHVGNAGTATIGADGGIIVTGDIITGHNTGSDIAVDGCGGGGSGGSLAIDGGNVTNTTTIDISADGGTAIVDASGGDDNAGAAAGGAGGSTDEAAPQRGGILGLRDRLLGGGGSVGGVLGLGYVVGVGNGGTANASADGGIIITGDIITGYNKGNTIVVGEGGGSAYPANGDCAPSSVAIDGGDVTNETTIDLSADGGTAIADGSGGDGNAGVATGGVGGILSLGNGGTATSSADGGILLVGDIITGFNQGNTISVGDVGCAAAPVAKPAAQPVAKPVEQVASKPARPAKPVAVEQTSKPARAAKPAKGATVLMAVTTPQSATAAGTSRAPRGTAAPAPITAHQAASPLASTRGAGTRAAGTRNVVAAASARAASGRVAATRNGDTVASARGTASRRAAASVRALPSTGTGAVVADQATRSALLSLVGLSTIPAVVAFVGTRRRPAVARARR